MFTLLCAATIWINKTQYPWNDHDKKVYKRAVQVCSTDVRYKKGNPCVKWFIKTDEQSYQCLCGPKSN